MFCPLCKAEYREGFTECHDCDVALVDQLSPGLPESRLTSAERSEPDDVAVATVQGPGEEAQIVSFLQAHGIPVRIRGEIARKVYGFTIDGLGAGQVIVPRHLAAEARDLLDKADRGELEIAAEGN